MTTPRTLAMRAALTVALGLAAAGCSKSDPFDEDTDTGTDTDTASPEDTAGACLDGVDNDGDGLTDCDDEECAIFPFCEQHEEDCGDGADDDGDGLTDCDDEGDCASAPECGGSCAALEWLAPAAWGQSITEINDDLDADEGCVQYEVVIEATEPAAGIEICLYVDDATEATGCADPGADNPVTFAVTLCQGEHVLHAAVEPAGEIDFECPPSHRAVTVWENPSCQVTAPVLSTDAGAPTPWNAAAADFEVGSSGARAELWVGGLLAGDGVLVSGIAAFPGVALGADGSIAVRARCFNEGSGNGDSWSPAYFLDKDATAPVVDLLSPADGAIFATGDCPFDVQVEIAGVEAGDEICAFLAGHSETEACVVADGDDPFVATLQLAACVEGAGLELTVEATDSHGNAGSDSAAITIGDGLFPAVALSWPADGALYGKATDAVAGTDAYDGQIVACTGGDWNPANIFLEIDGALATGLVPAVSAVACGALSHTITFPPFAFAQDPSGLPTPHSVSITVSDGVNTSAPSGASFRVDTVAPALAILDPVPQFLVAGDDHDPGTPEFEAYARVQAVGLEAGLPAVLAVTNGGAGVGESPYSLASASSAVAILEYDWSGGAGVVLQAGQNALMATAADEAGNEAVPATRLAVLGLGAVTSPAHGAILGAADDCDGDATYGFPVAVSVPGETTDGTEVLVQVSSADGGWSFLSEAWPTDCAADPCAHSFCVAIPAAEVEQSDIAVTLRVGPGWIPGTPDGIAVDLSAPPMPATLPFSVLQRRAAEVRLPWIAVEDPQSGPMAHWEIRCAIDGVLDETTWDAAMNFVDGTDGLAGGPGGSVQAFDAHADKLGAKLRAGHAYSCGVRGVSRVGLASPVSRWDDIDDAHIGFLQHGNPIEGYTRADYDWWYWPSVSPAGDINDDGYDDLLVGYGGSTIGSSAAAIFFGSAAGPAFGLDVTCADASFGAAMAGIGDFDGDNLPDFAVGAPDEDTVYLFRGDGDLGAAALDCSDADAVILGSAGAFLGSALAAGGDFDGDGFKDLVIGATYESGGEGAAYLVFGRAETAWPVTVDLILGGNADGSLRIPGAAGSAGYLGDGLTAFDFDKDGASELVAAAPYGGASYRGQVVILAGDPAAAKTPDTVVTVPWASLQVIDSPASTLCELGVGHGLAPVDWDGDGWVDLAVGAHYANLLGPVDSGNVLIYPNVASSIQVTHTYTIHGDAARDALGVPVAGVYDLSRAAPVPWRLNGIEGVTPTDQAIFAGAYQYNPGSGVSTGPGFAALWYAEATGNAGVADADLLFGPPAGAVAHYWAAFVGDLDGDGWVDLAVGDTGYGSQGRILVFY